MGNAKVPLKSFNISVRGGDPVTVHYKELIVGALNAVPEGGLAPSGMRERIGILDKLEISKDGFVYLSEEEFKTVYNLVKDQKFAVVDKGFVRYIDDLEKISNDMKNGT